MTAFFENEANTMVFLCKIDGKSKRQSIKATGGIILMNANSYDGFMQACKPLFVTADVSTKANSYGDIVHSPF